MREEERREEEEEWSKFRREQKIEKSFVEEKSKRVHLYSTNFDTIFSFYFFFLAYILCTYAHTISETPLILKALWDL